MLRDDGSEIGAHGGTRPTDAHLRTVALYPLSYAGRPRKGCVSHILAHQNPAT